MFSPTIKPFKATYYNPKIIKDISGIICPPYDVIDKNKLRQLRLAPYNFCKILISPNSNYKVVGKRFYRWLKKKVLVEEDSESLYLYEQQFTYEGKIYHRWGIISLLRMDKKGVIHPHEFTHRQPKEDRSRIIREVEANLSPIFVIVPQKIKIFTQLLRIYLKRPPFLKFKDFEGNINKLWRVKDAHHIKKIVSYLESSSLVIADGHHRFEVAYDYYKKNKNRFKDINYILAYITSLQEGLFILPTHRVVTLEEDINSFLAKLQEYFLIRKISKNSLKKRLKASYFCLGIYFRGSFYFLRLLKSKILDKISESRLYSQLDTWILHKFILPLFKIKENIDYTHSIDEAEKMAGNKRVAFLLRAPSLKAVLSIARRGELLPQKTTYFYPKIPCGMIIRRFERR